MNKNWAPILYRIPEIFCLISAIIAAEHYSQNSIQLKEHQVGSTNSQTQLSTSKTRILEALSKKAQENALQMIYVENILINIKTDLGSCIAKTI